MTDVELLIKIPEEVKNRLCFGVTYQKDIQVVCEALNNCTQLPKNHGNLVDVSELLTTTEIRKDGSEMTYVPYAEIEQAHIIIKANKKGN